MNKNGLWAGAVVIVLIIGGGVAYGFYAHSQSAAEVVPEGAMMENTHATDTAAMMHDDAATSSEGAMMKKDGTASTSDAMMKKDTHMMMASSSVKVEAGAMMKH